MMSWCLKKIKYMIMSILMLAIHIQAHLILILIQSMHQSQLYTLDLDTNMVVVSGLMVIYLELQIPLLSQLTTLRAVLVGLVQATGVVMKQDRETKELT